MPTADRRSWWCRLGLHRWQRVTFREGWPFGRRCRLCDQVQQMDCYGWWSGSTLTPNKDTDGYY